MANLKLAQPLFGLDSTSMVSVAGHRAVGSKFACRYLSRSTWKVLSAGEAAEYKLAGLGLVLVFEDSATNALRGYAVGRADAEFAETQARERGVFGGPIFFAVDFDTAGRESAVLPYFEGVKSVLGVNAGVYGGYPVCKYLLDHGIPWAWQTYAWSAGRLDPRAQVYQYSNGHTVAGVGTDYNKAFYANYGQVGYKPAPPVDPNHYERFDGTKRKLLGGKSERDIVKAYDAVRAQQTHTHHPHSGELADLRKRCKLAAARVWWVAHHPEKAPSPVWGAPKPTWGVSHRGWRFQQLRHRYKGARVAK